MEFLSTKKDVMDNKDPLESLRSRWRRWLGQKTRRDKTYWVTLLDINWLGWASNTLAKHDIDIERPQPYSTPQEIKAYYLRAIDCSDFDDLARLDERYATVLFEEKYK